MSSETGIKRYTTCEHESSTQPLKLVTIDKSILY